MENQMEILISVAVIAGMPTFPIEVELFTVDGTATSKLMHAARYN